MLIFYRSRVWEADDLKEIVHHANAANMFLHLDPKQKATFPLLLQNMFSCLGPSLRVTKSMSLSMQVVAGSTASSNRTQGPCCDTNRLDARVQRPHQQTVHVEERKARAEC